MNQSAASQPSRKKAVFSLLILLALTCVIVLIFRDHWAEITAALAQLNLWQVLVVLALGISYPLLEGCVSYVIVRGRLPGFTLRQGIDNAWCGTFGNVVTLGAGAVPVQTWYLHQAGLPIGPGVGLMTLQYVFHKTTVLLYATVMLLLQHKWLAANTTGVLKYLPMAYAVVALVIVALVLVCVSPLVQNLARWALGFLPKTEKWQQRRADWLEQLDVLGTESRLLLADKMEELMRIQVDAVKGIKIDKVTVWDGGEQKDGKTATAGFVSGLMKSIPPMNEMFDMAGMELPRFLGKNKEEPAAPPAPAEESGAPAEES